MLWQFDDCIGYSALSSSKERLSCQGMPLTEEDSGHDQVTSSQYAYPHINKKECLPGHLLLFTAYVACRRKLSLYMKPPIKVAPPGCTSTLLQPTRSHANKGRTLMLPTTSGKGPAHIFSSPLFFSLLMPSRCIVTRSGGISEHSLGSCQVHPVCCP